MKKNDFYNLGIKLTDKIEHHRYDRFYPMFLEPLRKNKFNMLEIGVSEGGSLKVWEEYFPDASIYAVDKDQEWKNERCTVIKCDQSQPRELKKLVDTIPSCEFIIDDGSHHPHHQMITFIELFQNVLEEGGTYIIEDIECNYWNAGASVYGYNIGHFNMMDYLKNLPDQINGEFSKSKNSLNISTITFAHNCVIITKKTAQEVAFTNRPYRYNDMIA